MAILRPLSAVSAASQSLMALDCVVSGGSTGYRRSFFPGHTVGIFTGMNSIPFLATPPGKALSQRFAGRGDDLALSSSHS